MMAPIREAYLARVAAVQRRPPGLPVLSCVTGTWLTDAEATGPSYWADHLCGTVTLTAALGTLLADPSRVFVEVGRADRCAASCAVTRSPTSRRSR